ncbi:MAG: TIGR04283 family arsenosugar biosynthesis glycosyltransferase [Planctomycetota bacterium]
MTSSAVSLSVVIPTYNESARIAVAIESAWAANADEIIVADGGSSDDTIRLADELGATILRVGRRGRGAQISRGTEVATSDVVLVLHADNRLHSSVKCQLERAGRPAWGGFWQTIDASPMTYRLLEWGNATRVRWTSRVFGDQAMFVRRDVLLQVGGFQEIPLMEDVEISHRLRAICPATLLPGRVTVSARRWQARGLLRQTWLNWRIQWAYARGVSPDRLCQWYR